MEQLYKCLSAALSKHIKSATVPLPDNMITRDLKIQIPVLGGRYFFCRYFPENSQRLLNIKDYFQRSWWLSRTLQLRSCCWVIDLEKSNRYCKGSFILLASFHCAGMCYASYQRRKAIISLTHMWILWATVSDWPGKACSLAQKWHGCCGRN